jgi:hypothetical protein
LLNAKKLKIKFKIPQPTLILQLKVLECNGIEKYKQLKLMDGTISLVQRLLTQNNLRLVLC